MAAMVTNDLSVVINANGWTMESVPKLQPSTGCSGCNKSIVVVEDIFSVSLKFRFSRT